MDRRRISSLDTRRTIAQAGHDWMGAVKNMEKVKIMILLISFISILFMLLDSGYGSRSIEPHKDGGSRSIEPHKDGECDLISSASVRNLKKSAVCICERRRFKYLTTNS